MSHEVPWNKLIVEEFIEQAMLTTEEEWVLRTRVAGWTRTKQADELGMSISTVDKIIATLKKKYDGVAKYDPLLPPRRMSPQEEYLDNN